MAFLVSFSYEKYTSRVIAPGWREGLCDLRSLCKFEQYRLVNLLAFVLVWKCIINGDELQNFLKREISLGCENQKILVIVYATRRVTFPMLAVDHTEKKRKTCDSSNIRKHPYNPIFMWKFLTEESSWYHFLIKSYTVKTEWFLLILSLVILLNSIHWTPLWPISISSGYQPQKTYMLLF